MTRRMPVFAFAFLLAGSLMAQQPLERAWDLAAQGHREEAIVVASEWVRSHPNDADGRLLLGSLLMEQGHRDESLEQLTAATRLRPGSWEAQNALGEAYHKFGDDASARPAFEKAVSLKADSGIAQSNLGLALLATGQSEAAAKHLDRAIQLLGRTDDAADARYLRAKIYAASGAPEMAESQLKEAVAIRPDFPEAWSDLGQAYKTLLDDAGALASFERAVAENPADAVAQYRLGAEYLHQGQAHLAVEHLRQAMKLNASDQSTLNSLQIALRRDGDIDGANQVKQQLAELLLEKDRISQKQLAAVKLNNDGVALEKTGDLAGALNKYEEASRLDPDHAGIRLNYGIALLRLRRSSEGIEQLRSALRQDPANAAIRKALDEALIQAPR